MVVRENAKTNRFELTDEGEDDDKEMTPSERFFSEHDYCRFSDKFRIGAFNDDTVRQVTENTGCLASKQISLKYSLSLQNAMKCSNFIRKADGHSQAAISSLVSPRN